MSINATNRCFEKKLRKFKHIVRHHSITKAAMVVRFRLTSPLFLFPQHFIFYIYIYIYICMCVCVYIYYLRSLSYVAMYTYVIVISVRIRQHHVSLNLLAPSCRHVHELAATLEILDLRNCKLQVIRWHIGTVTRWSMIPQLAVSLL